ncbi:MAG: transposase [Phycisphaerales bacterium]|nr:MAG: transposase [Phycisphaerales bacterium]
MPVRAAARFRRRTSGLDSERQIAWRCSDSLSLRAFLRQAPDQGVPDHSLLSRTRWRWAARNAEERRLKDAERCAVCMNGRLLKGERSKPLHRRRGKRVERTLAHLPDNRGTRRAHLRGRENLARLYLIQVAAFNLGLILRKLCVHGTPRQRAALPPVRGAMFNAA